MEKAAPWRGGGGVEGTTATWRPEDVKREREICFCVFNFV